ncbi:MAG: penicillin acylase family protein [Bacteroidetes bacterium]|nr:penicillin acylase family protein [Bacteroidota bacterium]
MQKWLKISIGIIISLLILLVVAGFIFYNMLTNSIPKYSGQINVPGISKSLKIYRDSMGVPYIIAGSDEDAAFALGYVHAEDRLFSMDLIRRAGEGKLSEIIGPKTVPFDKMFRTIGITETAKKILAQMDPVMLKILSAYSNGVNFYINQAKGKYPIEFDLLNYDPQPWKPLDCIVLGRMMAWELNISWWSDFAYIDLIQKFGYDKVKDIIPSYPENAPTIIPQEIKKLPHASNSFMKTDQAFRNFIGWTGTHIGSNNWVVNGNLSATGKPIIVNDTHLAFSAPGRWYVAVIHTPKMKIAGFTLPGTPGIIIGENGNIAWALTNIMEDDADFYSEQLDSTGTKYFYNGAWQNLAVRKETIKVKDSSNVNFEIKSTDHGPIISDIHPYNFIFTNKNISESNKNAVISMHWLGNYVSNEEQIFYKIDKAKNWSEFKEALQDYSVPGQNFVYGDKEGNIGYLFGARLPIRNSNTKEFIYDGTTDHYDWQGFVPSNELPQLFNPPQNYIASANNKTVKDFKYYISDLWEPSSRIERITQLLNSKDKFSVNDFKKFQMDFVSPYAEKITNYILNAFNNVKVTDQHLQLALNLLRQWEYKMDQYSQAPAIYSEFFKYLMQNIFLNKMGEALYDEYVFVQNIPLRTVTQLMNNPQSSWFDDPSTSQVETRDDIIRKSMDEALTDLEKKYGEDPANWQWGRLHYVLFKHPFSGVSSIVDKVLNIGLYEIGGDGTTIFNTEYSFTKGLDNYPQFKHGEFENNLGPVMRYIYDFSKPNEINLILSTGESGNFLSKHYKDMTKFWLTGKYLKIKTDVNSIDNPNNKLLLLKPVQ